MDIKNKNNLRLTFSPVRFHTCPPAHLLTCHAFTLIEILTVLVIIGIIVTGMSIAWNRVYGRYHDDVAVVAPLGDMKRIQRALLEGYFPDTGGLPCAEEQPVSATMYLCLHCDRKDILDGQVDSYPNNDMEEVYLHPWSGKNYECVGRDDWSPECKELYALFVGRDSWDKLYCGRSKGALLADKVTGDKRTLVCKGIKSKGMMWNKYYSRGWRGPYLESNATLNATFFDPETYPADEDGNPVYLPALATIWADKLEEMALKEEQKEKPDEALIRQYRRAKYYQILKPEKTRCLRRDGHNVCKEYSWEIPKESACIVCAGPDGLIQSEAMWQFCEETCEGADKDRCKAEETKCKKTCKIKYETCMVDYYRCIDGYDICMADYHACKAEEDACLAECYKLQGYKDCHVACVALREPCCKECCANKESCVSRCMKDKGSCGKTCRIYRPDQCGGRCAKDFCKDCLDKRAECEEIKAQCDNLPDCDTIKEDCDSQRTACLEGCANVFDECRTEYERRCQSQCLRKVKRTDPDDPDYIDIGDDILLFVFSGDIRSPLDR